MIVLKSKDEIETMAKAASVTAQMLVELPEVIVPGMSTRDIDEWVEHYIRKHGMKPAFKGYGGFPASACVSVNEEVVHGIPSKRRILREGDIVSVDLGTIYEGYYSDAARTYPVGKISDEHARLIKVAEESFFEGLKYCRKGNRLRDVSHAIQQHVEAAGFGVIRDYVGHGVGRNLHEVDDVGQSDAEHERPEALFQPPFRHSPSTDDATKQQANDAQCAIDEAEIHIAQAQATFG